MQKSTLFLAGLGVYLLWPVVGSAIAHGVFIFAWPDGPQICTESYFTKNSKVHDGVVRMLDAAGRELASGRTDDTGIICFKQPSEPSDLILVVEASEGHRAEFQLRAENWVTEGKSATPPVTPPSSVDLAPITSIAEPLETFRAVFREELQAQLNPLRRSLAVLESELGSKIRNIVGGLGWLAGLFGCAFWFSGWRQKK
ncbi:MAG: hypothetical protein LBV77_01520 [Candidatus Adiutrix intracellularis]|jgi:nickel transport protein|nr:hypothetical protein [Candidatus Adiutrix intracellularis]